MSDPIAVLYQSSPAPPVGGIYKPMKPAGYRDSGADIAFALRARGHSVVVPVPRPDPANDADWSFPDTAGGIAAARSAGATVLWANTVLYADHPIQAALTEGVELIGQPPSLVERFDDKAETNALLARHRLPVPRFVLVGADGSGALAPDQFRPEMVGGWPAVVKPIRGRGSQGVLRVATLAELWATVQRLTAERSTHDETEYPSYGTAVIVEEYLPGEECTVTILPPGGYRIGDVDRRFERHWALPVVVRRGHVDGIAPYSGVVAVARNSAVADGDFGPLAEDCARAAELIGSRSVVRIDCRQDASGRWRLFDLNLKPNMTGPGRPGRDGQDGLVAIAARALGWDFPVLVENLARQRWRLS